MKKYQKALSGSCFFFQMFFDHSETFIGDDVFDPAGIVFRCLRVDPQRYQQVREYLMSFIDLLCDRKSLVRQADMAVFVYEDAAFVFQIADGTGYGGFGKAYLPGDVYRSDRCIFF